MRIKKGFTLIELMIVVAIVAFLSIIAVPNFFNFLAKAKRAEAYMNLNSIYMAQKAYWIENGSYSSVLSGPDGIGWKPEGYSGGGQKENFNYTYGFSQGEEGKHYFTGKLGSSHSHLFMAKADKNTFKVAAVGDIKGNGKMDVISIDHNSAITIEEDALS